MRHKLSKPEAILLLVSAALFGLALLGPAVAPPGSPHEFADHRVIAGLPFAMDVLSNLPFAIAGGLGLWWVHRVPARGMNNVQRAMSALFFGGLLITAAASAWYHAAPNDIGLAIDRTGMAVAFAGLLGLATACRVSDRAGALVGMAVLVLAPFSIQAAALGNVLPWALLQFGGMALVLWLAALRPRFGALRVRWGLVIVTYAIAKVLEINDHAIHELTGHLISGHTLKHLVASLAAWPVLAAVLATVLAAREAVQNAAGEKASKVKTRRPMGMT